MSSNTTPSGDQKDLVEPEGVNAGPPVDHGAPPSEEPASSAATSDDPVGGHPSSGEDGQGAGELLSRPGSDHGHTPLGPGQELSAEEG